MRNLAIDLYTPNGELKQRIICGHVDASRHITILLNVMIDKLKTRDVHIPEKIDHFNIFEGIITIYYISGYFMEISRFND